MRVVMHKQRHPKCTCPYYHYCHAVREEVVLGVVVVMRVGCVIEVPVKGVVVTGVDTAGKFREGQGRVGAMTPTESQALG